MPVKGQGHLAFWKALGIEALFEFPCQYWAVVWDWQGMSAESPTLVVTPCKKVNKSSLRVENHS
jgi:hypothetical protein